MSSMASGAPEDVMAAAKKCFALSSMNSSDFEEVISLLSDANTGSVSIQAFLLVQETDLTISVVHSAAKCRLPMNATPNPLRDEWIVFVGDRVTVEDVRHDPPGMKFPFARLMADEEVSACPKTVLTAADVTKLATVKVSDRPRKLTAAALLPVPLKWVEFFLKEPRSPLEGFRFVTDATSSWSGEDIKETKEFFVTWFQCIATNVATEAHPECALTETLPVFRLPNPEYTTWATNHLKRMLPCAAPVSRPPAPTPATEGMSSGLQAAMTKLATIVASKEEREEKRLEARERERANPTPKEIDDGLLCNLLGFAGLTWDDRHLLPVHWSKLANLPDKKTKYAYLRGVISNLATKVKAFNQFENEDLFDAIIAHDFAPKVTETSLHHGLSPLAFIATSLEAIEATKRKKQRTEGATHRTPADMARLEGKVPIPPSTILETVQIIEMLEVLCHELFGEQCPWANDLRELHNLLDESRGLYAGQPSLVEKTIPYALWQVISSGREVFLRSTQKSDLILQLNQSHGGSSKKIKTAILLIDGDAVPDPTRNGIPSPLLVHLTDRNTPKGPPGGPGKDRKPGKGGEPPPRAPGKPSPEDWDKAKIANPFGPHPVFATCPELQALIKKHPKVSLTKIAQAAGYDRVSNMPRGEFPWEACLTWTCLGECRNFCTIPHKANSEYTDQACKSLLGILLPGIKKLLALDRLPQTK